ncbi:MAG: MotA/TolQ/ExbB proton channel family protein [Acidobacteriota bacterium]
MSTILETFRSGGLVMVPLLLCSILAMAITIEKLVNLRLSRILKSETIAALHSFVERGQVESALAFCRRQPGIFNNIIRQGFEHYSFGREEVKEAMLDAARQQIPRLERYLGVLGTLAGVTPLLGLLGTVAGMIKVFNVIAEIGVGKADALAAGISEALVTTVTGLVIAIPSLVMYNIFRGRAEAIVAELERHSLDLVRRLFTYEQEADKRAPQVDRPRAAP